ncbi:hypothetical protein EDI_335080 [Entamoeba dispar SAW760]|uniref:Telomere length regulation protein conserved domain-containing protein n=1 Tax=Entamoeba dispar (strain ATCC PRA-260 / SAW760) TaxID=370354 RepID=B0ESY9_ENTDS|nr:uncharacterized protein EDI_335080 [Entamoeba dispar SAW760]EDR22352.1 hypothetical protein EDI_335080 [Entamoeba dispar SAW760]|eukprot:EDR22352.1 hypothetical protein EDI_335080 [Entamoeba dispar SAW760]
MALLWEENTSLSSQSLNESLEEMITVEEKAVDEIVLFLSSHNVYQHFMMLVSSLDKSQNWSEEHLYKLQEISIRFFKERQNWCSELLKNCQPKVINKVLSIAMKINNRLNGYCDEFFDVNTFYSYVYYQIFFSKGINLDKQVDALKQFKTINHLEKGIKVVIQNNEIINKYQILLNYLDKCSLQMRIDYLSFVYQKIQFTEQQFELMLKELSYKNYQIDISLYYDVFNQDHLTINQHYLMHLALQLCHSPKAIQLISLIFSLYSNKTYATTISPSSQWILTQYIIYIIRCIPYSTKTSLLSNGVNLRITSPVKKIQKLALILMNEMEMNNKEKRTDYQWNIKLPIEADGVEDIEESPVPIDENILSTEDEQLEDKNIIQDVSSKIKELNEKETSKRKVKKPKHIIEWLELFDDFGNRTYEEVELILSIGVELIKKSNKFVGPYLEEIIKKILTIKNIYRIEQFEEWQIAILYEVVTDKSIYCKKRGSSILIEKILIDKDIVLKTMKKCGYYQDWIDPLREYIVQWCYENKFEYNICQAIDYLKDYGTTSIVNDWFILYQNCRSNDRIVLSLLSGLLQVISLTSPDVFIWSCSDQIQRVLSQLQVDTVNHPNKQIRMAATVLMDQITTIVNTEIKSETQKEILLF